MKDAKGKSRTAGFSSKSLLVLAGVFLLATSLAPRAGSALAVFSVYQPKSAAFVGWATARGVRIVGKTPVGGFVLDHAPKGAFLSALRYGSIAIAVPLGLCSTPSGN